MEVRMRVIKFRAWEKSYKTMHYSKANEDKRRYDLISFDIGYSGYDPDDLIFMQYTGLKDKNGKEIYEGDIVKYVGIRTKIKYKHEVIFKYGCFLARCKEIDNLMYIGKVNDVLEIIGNIYQNKDLLK
jgi:uncharacterized phage protein (TIGR01671 family)